MMAIIAGLFTVANAEAKGDVYIELHVEYSANLATAYLWNGQKKYPILTETRVIDWSQSLPYIYFLSSPQTLSKITYREKKLYYQRLNSQENFYQADDQIEEADFIEMFKSLPESLAAFGASAWESTQLGEEERVVFWAKPETQLYLKIFSNSPWALSAFLRNIHSDQWAAVLKCFPESIFANFFKNPEKLKNCITTKEELAVFISLFPSKATDIRLTFQKELKEWLYEFESLVYFISRSETSDGLLQLVSIE